MFWDYLAVLLIVLVFIGVFALIVIMGKNKAKQEPEQTPSAVRALKRTYAFIEKNVPKKKREKLNNRTQYIYVFGDDPKHQGKCELFKDELAKAGIVVY